MPESRVTVVVPTLAADHLLVECVQSLEEQTLQDFDLVVVDNSGRRLVKETAVARSRATIIENAVNLGFGGAINQGWERSISPFVATLNDDAVAHPEWLEMLVEAMAADPRVGMCASRVVLRTEATLDSAGMLIAPDGTSKQRGHGQPACTYESVEDVLLPSGSAAMYRRRMLDCVGGFDAQFFLYCEDTDLGLRARRAGWSCLYVPSAKVDHQYSHSAGRASSLKAYYVERNRLQVVLKNFPWPMIPRALVLAFVRYWWHFVYALQGKGSAAQFHSGGQSSLQLGYLVLRAHLSLLVNLPSILRRRREVLRGAHISDTEFRELLEKHSIGLREVASL